MILYWHVSINNIICILEKSNNIILESSTCILANASNLLTGDKNSSLIAFLNNYNFTVYMFENFGLISLTDTWAFIALSKLQK